MDLERWKQIDDLFGAALELDPDERRAFLDRACAGDGALREEVEKLLESDGRARDFIETPVVVVAPELFQNQRTALAAGHQFGPYTILSPLGSGGMGDVYLARDTRLARKVALKLLPADFAADRQRVLRFRQEARAASALNHPNIITVYEIGECDGSHFIATEYIEGDTLRRLVGKKGSVADSVDVVAQIAGALAAAHDAGIIHRDIKPENVMRRPDGYVKVLDFGLAKPIARLGAATHTEAGDTASVRVGAKTESTAAEPAGLVRTDTGVVMGTVRYMSPEQARGEALDSRTDVFSLGAVFYELLTGSPPFTGETMAVIFDAILNRAPAPPSRINPDVPPELERILLKTLEKDRELRYQTAADLRADLKRLRRDSRPEVEAGKAPAPRQPSRLLLLSASVLLAAAALFVSFMLKQTRPPAPPPITPLVGVPLTSYPGQERTPAFSPDGRQVAFSWDGEKRGNWDVYVKLIGTTAPPLRLTHSPDADLYPTWSPDGRHLAFVRQGGEAGIYLVPALGGPERKLQTLGREFIWGIGSISFSPDGKWLAYADKAPSEGRNSLFLLPLDGGERRRLTAPPADHWGDWNPVFSPDGRHLAFARYRFISLADVFTVPVEGGEAKQLTDDHRAGFGLAWTADGREIVYAASEGRLGLWKVSAGGGTPEWLGVGDSIHPAVSRAGNHLLAYVRNDADTNVWRVDVSSLGKGAARPAAFISSTRDDFGAQYSPDGGRIAFVSKRSGDPEIWVCAGDGSNPTQLTSLGSPDTGAPRWSVDGKRIAFNARVEGNADIYVVDAQGGAPRRLTTGEADEIAPGWSRDGRWLYFASLRTGDWQVWKMPANGGEAVQVTAGGGVESQESPDGRDLYFDKYGVPGVWKIPLTGGEESLVPELSGALSWALAGRGVFYINPDSNPAVAFYDLATRRVTRVAGVQEVRARSALHLAAGDLSVAPDGKWLLFTQVDQRGSDIMVAEGFR